MSSLTSEFLTAFKILSAGQAGVEASEAGEDQVRVRLTQDDQGQVYQVTEELIKELRKLRRTPGISSPDKFPKIVRQKLAKYLEGAAEAEEAMPAPEKADLFDLIRYGKRDELGALVADGADVKTSNNVGMTPLHEAARQGQAEMVAILLSHGADPNLAQVPHGSQGNDLSWTPLHYACNSGSDDSVKRLLQAGAETGPEDLDKRRPLHLAAKSGNPASIGHLLDGGAEVSAADRNKKTALHYAAHFGHAEAFLLLVERGVDVNQEDSSGHTALQECTPALASDEQILEALKKAGGDPDWTPQKAFEDLSVEALEDKYKQKIPKRFAAFIQDKSYEKLNGKHLDAAMLDQVKQNAAGYEEEVDQVANLKIYFNQLDEEDELRVYSELYLDYAINSDGHFGPSWHFTFYKVDPAKKSMLPFAVLDSDQALEAKPFLVIDGSEEDQCPVHLVWDGEIFIKLADSIDDFLIRLSG